MRDHLLHVFRNTPLGRETLMQSGFFCQRAGLAIGIYIPRHPQFLMHFHRGIVTVELDRAFLRAPESAHAHASEILKPFSIESVFIEPRASATPDLPDLPVDFDYMCCPRSISDLSSKIGLGHIGSRVRAIAKTARFPVFMPAAAFKEWNRVVCFFGGSANASLALRCGRALSKRSNTPMLVFTHAESAKDLYEEGLKRTDVLEDIGTGDVEWLYFEQGDFDENLYAVPHDALVVVGAYGHGVAKDLLFGSKMETIQTVLPNPMLIVGPSCAL